MGTATTNPMRNGMVVRTSERYSGGSTNGTKNSGQRVSMNLTSMMPVSPITPMTRATTTTAMVAIERDLQWNVSRRAWTPALRIRSEVC